LGAATADGIYAIIAAFGFTTVFSLFIEQATIFRLAGGLFLLYLGIRTLLAKPAEKAADTATKHPGLWGAYLSTLALTITNPMTILAFVGIFAGLGAPESAGDPLASLVMVIGIVLGSAGWWLLLSGGVGLLRQRLDLRLMRWINGVSGVVIMLFALAILVELL
jgi:threonine/homoserine/homoserine lactone efflux protein